MSKIHILSEETQRVTDVQVDDELCLVLSETPTTGFRWLVEATDRLLKLDEDFLPAGTGAIGAAGRRRIRFRANDAGSARITGKLLRSWEGDSSIINRLTLDFTIT